MGAKGFWLVPGPVVKMLNDTDPLLPTDCRDGEHLWSRRLSKGQRQGWTPVTEGDSD